MTKVTTAQAEQLSIVEKNKVYTTSVKRLQDQKDRDKERYIETQKRIDDLKDKLEVYLTAVAKVEVKLEDATISDDGSFEVK